MKKLYFIYFFLLNAFSGHAQIKYDTEELIPDELIIQHAGSIGFMSAGAGYTILKKKATISIHYGNVPKKFGGPLHIAAIKFQWKPFNIHLGNFSFQPVNPGVFASYHFGDEYFLLLPRNKYPKLYYWWSSGLRIHPTLSHALEYNFPQEPIKSAGIYFEWNTNDLYIASYFENRKVLKPGDIIKLGIGCMVRF
jgi:hypothetical protein